MSPVPPPVPYALHADVKCWSATVGRPSYEDVLDVLVDANLVDDERVAVTFMREGDVMRFYGDSTDDLEFAVSAATSGTRVANPVPHAETDW